MAVGWSAAIRREGSTGRISGTVDFTRAMPSLEATGKYWAREVSRVLLENMKRGIPADTGYARSHIHWQSFDQGRGYHVGVLGLTGKHGESLEYLALMDRAEGIKRHFVSFTNPDGSVRDAFVNWARRHGFSVYKSPTTGRAVKRLAKGYTTGNSMLSMRGLMVWGYSRPWATNAFVTAGRVAHELLQSLYNTLGKTQAAWSRYTSGSAAGDFEE